MDMRVAGALFGFVVGSIGYVIVKFWLIPIREYRRLKLSIKEEVEHYQSAIHEHMWNNQKNKRLLKVRKDVLELIDCYDHQIPVWYKILLDQRKESPHEAARHLMDLDNIRDITHALKRFDKARTALLIK